METSGSDGLTGKFCRMFKLNNSPNPFKVEEKNTFFSPFFGAGIDTKPDKKN